MLNTHFRRRLQLEEPRGWRRLWEQAQRERDPKMLDALIQEMNRMLAEHEKKVAGKMMVGQRVD